MLSAALGFVAGIGWLQRQAALPGWAVLAVATLAGVLLVLIASRSGAGKLGAGFRFAGWAFLGVAWAGGFAQVRLADALDPALEGRDVEVTEIGRAHV